MEERERDREDRKRGATGERERGGLEGERGVTGRKGRAQKQRQIHQTEGPSYASSP